MNAEEQFANLKFSIECSEMVLTRADRSLQIRGPGEIWQDEEGTVQFKIFADQAGYRGLQDYMSRPGIIGQLIPEEDYFTLEARDYCLPRWSAPRVLPVPRGGLDQGIACGYIYDLGQIKNQPANREFDHVTLRFRGKIEFPCNQGTQTIVRIGGVDRHTSSSLNAAFVDFDDYSLEVRHEQEHTFVFLQLPAGQLIQSTPSRIHETLQFVLGQELALMVTETTAGGQQVTRLTSPARGKGKVPPPLQFDGLDDGGHVWRLFTDYFRHVHRDARPAWHPISRHIGSVIESTAASLEARVLALAVAVEGLAGDCFPGIAPASPTLLAELDAVQAAIRTVTLEDQSRSRIKGSLDSMRRPRNSDVLRAFIANNHLPSGLYDSWTRLRNASAHGRGTGGRDTETTLRIQNEVLSLLYSLVFAAINYTGRRTDYSLPGWPTRAWPTRPPAVPPLPPSQASAPVAVAPQVAPPEIALPVAEPSASSATTKAPTSLERHEPSKPANT